MAATLLDMMEQLAIEGDSDERRVNDVLQAAAETQHIFLSKSIRTHASRICCRALQAARHGLIGNRGHCELLVGAKGHGKSTFLTFLEHVLSKLTIADDGDDGDDDSGDGDGDDDAGDGDGGDDAGDDAACVSSTST